MEIYNVVFNHKMIVGLSYQTVDEFRMGTVS